MQAQKTELLENFAVRLKAAMKRRTVTLQQIADYCGVGVSTVGAWSQAKNWPAVEIQPRLAEFLQTSVHFLIHGIPENRETTEYPSSGPDAVVREDAALHGTPATIEHEIRREFQKLVTAAQGDPQRLYWIAEQMKEHLAVPKKWREGRGSLIRVTTPSQTQDLSSATGLPIQAPVRRAHSA